RLPNTNASRCPRRRLTLTVAEFFATQAFFIQTSYRQYRNTREPDLAILPLMQNEGSDRTPPRLLRSWWVDFARESAMTHGASDSAAREIVFIDSDVAEIDSLRRGLRPSVAAHILDRAQPALVQMRDVLQGRDGVVAVHIIAHGRPGAVDFAGDPLTLETM